MTDRSRIWRAAVRALAATLLATLAWSAMPAAATAAAPNTNTFDTGRLDRTVRFMQEHQNLDGGFGSAPGRESDPLFSAWVALALAAGGVNPLDQAKPGGVDVYSFLQAHAGELDYTTDFDRVLLVAIAAGADPRNFGGVDLIGAIVGRQLPDGSFPHSEGATRGGINDTAFAVMALSAIPDPALRPVVERAVQWMQEVQHEDGSWGWGLTSESSSDITASVIQALRAAGVGRTEAEDRGWAYIRTAHRSADGGFVYSPPEPESNTASTSWAVQGMWAAGLEPHTWVPAGPSPLDYLASMQESSGMIRWKASKLHDPLHNDNPLWMTAYAAPAFAGYPLPIPQVARAVKTQTPSATTPEAGVIAGGGGEGAPNFSRPEPQSTGTTAGGVRRVAPRATDEDEAQRQERTSGTARDDAAADDAPAQATAGSNGTADAGVTRDLGPAPAAQTAGAAGALNGTPNGAGTAGTGTGGGVSGTVIQAAARDGASGSGDGDAAAPGLQSAKEDTSTALAAGLAALLLLALAAGMNLERQRVAAP